MATEYLVERRHLTLTPKGEVFQTIHAEEVWIAESPRWFDYDATTRTMVCPLSTDRQRELGYRTIRSVKR